MKNNITSLTVAGSIGLMLAAGTAIARTTPKPLKDSASAPTIIVHIHPLNNNGGLPTITGKDPINVQLTTGLQKYLASVDGTKFAADVVTSSVSKAAPTGDNEFDLEGDLSHTKIDTTNAGPYLLVLRLYKMTDAGSTLIDQWAAEAATYLDLTDNYERDPAVNPQGLLGSVGDLVAAAVTAGTPSSQAEAFSALLKKASQFQRITAKVVADPDTLTAPGPPTLKSGDKYQIKVSCQDRGSVYLVSLDAGGNPSSLFIPDPDSEIDVAPNRPALVPNDNSIQVGEVLKPTDKSIVILVRISAVPPSGTMSSFREGDAPTPTPAPSPHIPAVQILTVGPVPSTAPTAGDPDVARLLTLAASDPDGTWLARKITVHFDPMDRPTPTPTPAPTPTPSPAPASAVSLSSLAQ